MGSGTLYHVRYIKCFTYRCFSANQKVPHVGMCLQWEMNISKRFCHNFPKFFWIHLRLNSSLKILKSLNSEKMIYLKKYFNFGQLLNVRIFRVAENEGRSSTGVPGGLVKSVLVMKWFAGLTAQIGSLGRYEVVIGLPGLGWPC